MACVGGLGINLTTADTFVLYDFVRCQTLIYFVRILKLISKLWIVPTALGKRSKYMSSILLTRGVLSNVCLITLHRNFAWTNWLSSKANRLLMGWTSFFPPHWHSRAANKEELLEMITHGAEKIINPNNVFVCVLAYSKEYDEHCLLHWVGDTQWHWHNYPKCWH
jgi:hypothetical protein